MDEVARSYTTLTYYDEPEDIDRRRRIGGFFGELLTVDGPAQA